MRERLTLAFVLLTLTLIGASFAARSYLFDHELHGRSVAALQRQVQSAAVAVDERDQLGQPVDQAFLATLTGEGTQLAYHVPGQADVVADGVGWDDGAFDATFQKDGDYLAVADAGDGTLVLRLDDDVNRHLVVPAPIEVVLLFVFLGLVAAGAGFLMARALSAPFRQLAVAASALGRGRSQLDLPRSRIREVRAISTALATSSEQLHDRLSREQQLAEHTSHVLRTPLTALRLELEDLRLHDDLSPEVAEAIDRSVRRIDQLDGVTQDLVTLTRQGSAGPGVTKVTLEDLATGVLQRWADELGHHDRAVTGAVEGELTTTYLPGPVEQILDLLLVEVMRRSRGAVRLEFEAVGEEHLRVAIRWAAEARRRADDGNDEALVRARAVAMAMGGRVEEPDAGGLLVRLPRR